MANTGAIVNAFKYWFDATPMGSLKLSTRQDALDYYDKFPSFKANLDKSLRSIPQSKIKEAMEKLARDYMTTYPPVEAWGNYLASAAGSVTAGEVASAAASGVAEASGILSGIAKNSLYLYIGIAAIGAFILPKLLKSRK